MKKIILLTITTVMLLFISTLSVSACEKLVTIDGVTYEQRKNETDGKYYIVSGFFNEDTKDKTEEINIAAEISGIPVLYIEGTGDPELLNDVNYSVKRIILPEGIKAIGYYGLSNFRGVEEIILPSTLEAIRTGGFSYMVSLKSIVIPEGVTKIGAMAFDNCKNLNKVVFEGKVTFIGSNAFSYCANLKKILLPETVKKICSGAFRGSGLVSVTVPEKAMVSYAEVFRDCKNLKTVVFDGCKRENGLVLGTRIFDGCTSLKKVCFPDETKCVKIAYEAFRNCKNLKNLCNSEKITKVNEKAFTGCKNLQRINLGEVTKIGKNAFYNCPKLKTVTLLNNEKAPKIQTNAFKKTASGIKFTVCGKAAAKSLKSNLKKSGLKNMKVCYVKYVNV